MKTLLVIANNNFGHSLSGGDRIFLNLIKYWSKKLSITVLASQESQLLIKKYLKSSPRLIISDQINPNNTPTVKNIIFHQFKRVIKGVKTLPKQNFDYVYSVSDFYPDLIPALIKKITQPKTKWIAGYYLLAPNPLSSLSPYNQNHHFLKGLIYFLGQIPSKILVKSFADHVFVTSTPDQKIFKNSFVIQGGVDPIKNQHPIPVSKRKYEAVYLGRLHHQKGVLQLIDIWSLLVKQRPKAKLAIIGDGELETAIRQKIKRLHLSQNIKLHGFLIGHKKHKIFKNSRIVLHPATYDSGGMAAAEAMAWGLPAVGYDLPALKTYYPQGMIKIKCFDQQQFADNILMLLNHPRQYKKYSQQAIQLIKNNWSWKNRLNVPLNQILSTKS